MEITDVVVHTLSAEDVKKAADATQSTAVIEVETDAGITGIGEASTSPWVVKTIIDAPFSNVRVQGLREILVGEDPFDVRKLWDEMFYGTYGMGRKGAAIIAISGVDIALWDIIGKASGRPIYELLGGNYRDSVRAYASTLFPQNPHDTEYMRGKSQRFVDEGFSAVKFGWGSFGDSPETDDQLLTAARETLGPEVDLMVDAGFCWETDVKNGVKYINQLDENHDLFWVEEPVYAENHAGYARLSESCQTRIVGGESEYTSYGFKVLLEQGQVDGVQPDVARSGGISQLVEIASLARRHGVPLFPHGYSTGIVIAASLQVIAATENALLMEYVVEGGDLRWELVNEEFQFEDGQIAIPDEPGLGISLNRDIIDRYTMDLDRINNK